MKNKIHGGSFLGRSGNRTLLVCGKCGLDKCNGTGNVRFADIDRQMSVFFIEGDTLFVEILKCLTGFSNNPSFFQVTKPPCKCLAIDLQIDDGTDIPQMLHGTVTVDDASAW